MAKTYNSTRYKRDEDVYEATEFEVIEETRYDREEPTFFDLIGSEEFDRYTNPFDPTFMDHLIAETKKIVGNERTLLGVKSKEEEQWWIEKSRRSPLHFGWFVFGHKPAPHHVKWIQQIFSLQGGENNKTIIVAPRASAKTTWMTIVLLWYISHRPWTCNMIISVAHKQATERLQVLRDMVENNAKYRRVFPHIRIDQRRKNDSQTLNLMDISMDYKQWRATVTRLGNPMQNTCFASGAGGRGVVGSRVNGILMLDDIMDHNSARSECIMDDLENWINGTLLPVLDGNNTRVVHVTTRWNINDMVVRQLKTKEWTHSETTALIEKLDPKTGAKRYDTYWPAHMPLKRLAAFYRSIGPTQFLIMFMGSAAAADGPVFQLRWLQQDLPWDRQLSTREMEDGVVLPRMPLFRRVWVSVDAAVTVHDASDNTAITTLGIDNEDNVYLLDLRHDKWDNMEVVKQVGAAYRQAILQYPSLDYKVMFETVSAQTIYLTLMANMKEVPMELVEAYAPNKDKVRRAGSLQAIASVGRFFMPQDKPWSFRVQSQFVAFNGDRNGTDDVVDSCSQIAVYEFGDIFESAGMQSQAQVIGIEIPGLNGA